MHAIDDRELALDVGRDGLRGEEGLAAPGVGGEPLQLALRLGGEPDCQIVTVAEVNMVAPRAEMYTC